MLRVAGRCALSLVRSGWGFRKSLGAAEKLDFRVIRGRRSAADFILRTEQSERGHLVLLALGIASVAWAWSIGWHGWAVYLSVGNVVVNVYPILLQTYTRGRLRAVLNRGLQAGPSEGAA